MSPAEVHHLMASMMKAAREYPKTNVTKFVPTRKSSEVMVTAHANRIGFVYWTYDGQPIPRTALKALLETLPMRETA